MTVLAKPVPLVVATAVALTLAAKLTVPAHALIDVSGNWTVTVEGDYDDICGLAFVQNGTALTAQLDCGLPVVGSFNGSINQTTGAFNLSGTAAGFGVTFIGDVSADGQTLKGSWSAPSLSFSGSFSGTRGTFVSPTPLPPLSCPAGLSGSACLLGAPATGGGPNAWSQDGRAGATTALVAGIGVAVVGAGAAGFRRRRS